MVAVALTACGWCTWRQVTTWSSNEILYGHAVAAERYNYLALYGLGMAYWKDGKLNKAQEQFEAILKIQSDPTVGVEGGFEPAHRALGLLLAERHPDRPQLALEQLDEAIQARPQQPEPLRHKAWILATSRVDKVRDGNKAVELAEQALRQSPWKQAEYWDTLAAAQAEAGKFDEAVASAEKALQQARSVRADDLIPGIQRRLELFKAGKPYRAERKNRSGCRLGIPARQGRRKAAKNAHPTPARNPLGEGTRQAVATTRGVRPGWPRYRRTAGLVRGPPGASRVA